MWPWSCMSSEKARENDRGPGRPRAPATDERILEAALRLMAQGGYVRMSMDAVAAEAGVTKPTVYRRYSGKMQLALAAIIAFCDKAPPIYTGLTRSDLVNQMVHFRRALDRPHGMAMLGTMLAEEHDTPDLLANFREYLVYPRRRAVRLILERARANGELRDSADLDLVANMLIGAYYAQYLAGEPFADDWAEQIVDATLACLR